MGVRTGSVNLSRLWERDFWVGGVYYWVVYIGLKVRYFAVMIYNRWGLVIMLGEGGFSVGGIGVLL